MSKLAQGNTAWAKAQQKVWYNSTAQDCEYQPGEQVLVLLPTLSSKLLAQWQEPYPVVRQLGLVNYEVDIGGLKKTAANIPCQHVL